MAVSVNGKKHFFGDVKKKKKKRWKIIFKKAESEKKKRNSAEKRKIDIPDTFKGNDLFVAHPLFFEQ